MNKFQEIIDALADVVFVHHPVTGEIEFINETCFQLYGYSAQELLSKGLKLIVADENDFDFKKQLKLIGRAAKGEVLTFELKTQNSSGDKFWVEVVLKRAIIDKEVKVVATVRDITPRKQAISAYKDRELLLQSINQNISEGLYRSHSKGGLIYANNAFVKMFGYDNLKEMLSVKSLDLYASPKDRKGLTPSIIKEGVKSNIDTHFKRKDGTTFWGSNSFLLTKDKEGHDIFDGAVRDITEERESKRKIEESQRILLSINQNISEGIYRSHSKGGLIYANDAFAKMFGYDSAEDILSIKSLDLYAKPKDRKGLTPTVLEVGFRSNIDIHFKRKNGSTFWGINSFVLTKDHEGNDVFDGAVRDVTEEREVQFKIEESQQILESINRNISEGLYRSRPGGGIIYANKALAKMFGCSSVEELLALKTIDFYADPSHRDALMNSVYENGMISNLEVFYRRKDGSTFWGEVSATLTKDNEDNDIFEGAIRDITHERESKQKVEESERILTSINQNISEGVYRSYSKGGLIYANDAFAKMFGYDSVEEILSVKSLDLYPRLKDRKKLTKNVISHGSRSNIETRFKRKDGSIFWGLNSAILTKDHEGNDIFDGAVRDISHEKKAAEELNALNEELLERNFELDQLVYKTSHDLRSPLRSVLGLTNLMKLENPDQIAYFDRIEERILKMDEFIKSMLNYSRANRLDLKNEDVHFPDIIAACVTELEYLDGFSEFNILETYTGNLSEIKVDKLRLSIVFNNIISNSFKYRNPKTKESYLKINISHKKNLLVIVFDDNGIGIDKKYLKKVFDMFFRATEISEGSGLGMYIVKQAIEKLNGTVSINSELHKGTIIKVEIPS